MGRRVLCARAETQYCTLTHSSFPSSRDRSATIEADPRFVPHLYVIGAWEFVCAGIILLLYISQRWRFYKKRGGWNPTLMFINVVYIFFISYGVNYIYSGCIIIAVLGDNTLGIVHCVAGVADAAPYIAALIYGRKRLFKVMARKFEDKRRGLDGAVIAELMNDPALRRGADWWIHHGNNLADEYPDLFDHRRNWTRAVIVKIEDKRYSIDPNVVQQWLGFGSAQSGDARFASFARGGGRGGKSSSGGKRSFFGGGTRSGVASWQSVIPTSFFGHRKVAPVPAALEWIARSEDVKEDAVGLLTKAQDNLRTLRGQDLTHGLMAAYVYVVKETRLENVYVWLLSVFSFGQRYVYVYLRLLIRTLLRCLVVCPLPHFNTIDMAHSCVGLPQIPLLRRVTTS